MEQEFEILDIIDCRKHGQYIMVRQIVPTQDFEISSGAHLGTVPLNQFLDMPRALDDNGYQRSDLFIFQTLGQLSPESLEKGRVYKLSFRT